MNDTKKPLNERVIERLEVQKKLHNLLILLMGLNAYGSLSLDDYNLIEDYIKGAFGYELPPLSEE